MLAVPFLELLRPSFAHDEHQARQDAQSHADAARHPEDGELVQLSKLKGRPTRGAWPKGSGSNEKRGCAGLFVFLVPIGTISNESQLHYLVFPAGT